MKKYFSATGWSGGHWINDCKQTDNFEEADILVLEGGGDIATSIYGEKSISRYSYNDELSNRDKIEISYYKRAVEKGLVIIGLCRGTQLITALQEGGKLVQDINHPGRHIVYTKDAEFVTNSIHHQMCYPWNCKNYEVLGWCKGLSDIYITEGGKTQEFPECATKDGYIIEPEIIYYPDVKAIGSQFHPEMMQANSPAVKYMNKLLQEIFFKEEILV